MSAADFYIKEGDSDPVLLVTVIDEDGEVVPLTTAVSATFYMIDPGSEDVKIDGESATIVGDGSTGQLQYDWQTDGSDTDTPGVYNGEFEITWSNGKESKVPNFRYLKIKISRSIDASD